MNRRHRSREHGTRTGQYCSLPERFEAGRKRLFEIASDVPEHDQRDSDGKDGVNDGHVPDHHDSCANEDGEPSERVLDEVPADEFLRQRGASFHSENGGSVKSDAQNSQDEHPRDADFLWIGEPTDGVAEDEAETDQQHDAGDRPAEEAKLAITIGVTRSALAPKQLVNTLARPI